MRHFYLTWLESENLFSAVVERDPAFKIEELTVDNSFNVKFAKQLFIIKLVKINIEDYYNFFYAFKVHPEEFKFPETLKTIAFTSNETTSNRRTQQELPLKPIESVEKLEMDVYLGQLRLQFLGKIFPNVKSLKIPYFPHAELPSFFTNCFPHLRVFEIGTGNCVLSKKIIEDISKIFQTFLSFESLTYGFTSNSETSPTAKIELSKFQKIIKGYGLKFTTSETLYVDCKSGSPQIMINTIVKLVRILPEKDLIDT